MNRNQGGITKTNDDSVYMAISVYELLKMFDFFFC